MKDERELALDVAETAFNRQCPDAGNAALTSNCVQGDLCLRLQSGDYRRGEDSLTIVVILLLPYLMSDLIEARSGPSEMTEISVNSS